MNPARWRTEFASGIDQGYILVGPSRDESTLSQRTKQLILSQLAGYLAEHRRVAIKDLSYRFDTSPEALRGMLGTLERKGRVRRVDGGAACASTCGNCDVAAMETYEWVGEVPGE